MKLKSKCVLTLFNLFSISVLLIVCFRCLLPSHMDSYCCITVKILAVLFLVLFSPYVIKHLVKWVLNK